MGEGGHYGALARLAECLRQCGVQANVREWPKGQALSVTVNLAVQHSDGHYRWHEGLTECDHPDSDPAGAAEQLVALCRRLQGPSFSSQFPGPGGDEG